MLNPESISSSTSQETALQHLLIFRYRFDISKNSAEDALKFLGKLTYPEKCPVHLAVAYRFLGTGYHARIFGMLQ
jgi:hypothetical protein